MQLRSDKSPKMNGNTYDEKFERTLKITGAVCFLIVGYNSILRRIQMPASDSSEEK